MNLDSTGLIKPTDIVRGCPCYKEFGKTEKVCLNNDSVLPIRAILIDPTFFNSLQSKTNLEEFQSNSETLCYLVMFLDRDEGYCYCVSQNQRIRINNQDVKVSEIDSALQFVTSLEKSRDGVLCSDCLYKYIRTLGESSEGFLTDDERNEIIGSYVQKIANTMAMQLSGYVDREVSTGLDFSEYISVYTRELKRSRGHLTSMIRNLKKTDVDADLIQLIDAYSTLTRLESIFLFYVQTINDESTNLDPLETLQFMVNISEKVMSINDEIRDKTNNLIEKDAFPNNIQEMLTIHSQKRKTTEYRFSKLVSMLNEFDSHTK
ncbi:MAG: hypothetical protein E3J86_01320 [Candidatus Thorarchaeota archaeon]|nr:MAG: hypothetical protein E3J86_01320 [Candidatus Thorarchaeota archaeon]